MLPDVLFAGFGESGDRSQLSISTRFVWHEFRRMKFEESSLSFTAMKPRLIVLGGAAWSRLGRSEQL
jgi:hypothetical protein